MRQYTQTEQLAFQQRHPKIQYTSWQLVYGKQILFGPSTYALCVYWKKIHLPAVKNKELLKIKGYK